MMVWHSHRLPQCSARLMFGVRDAHSMARCSSSSTRRFNRSLNDNDCPRLDMILSQFICLRFAHPSSRIIHNNILPSYTSNCTFTRGFLVNILYAFFVFDIRALVLHRKPSRFHITNITLLGDLYKSGSATLCMS